MRSFLVALLLAFGLSFAAPAWAAVDINAADATELDSLPGIGPSLAAAIVEYRTANGPFKTIDELDNVSGIGPATVEKLRAAATIGAGTPAAGATPAAPAAKTPTESSTSGAKASSAPTAATASAAPAAAGGCTVNINTADATALDAQLPGVGPSTAAKIIEYRTANGPFASCDGLLDVKGIGDATLEKMRSCCTVK